jgi:hypothetical protein
MALREREREREGEREERKVRNALCEERKEGGGKGEGEKTTYGPMT